MRLYILTELLDRLLKLIVIVILIKVYLIPLVPIGKHVQRLGSEFTLPRCWIVQERVELKPPCQLVVWISAPGEIKLTCYSLLVAGLESVHATLINWKAIHAVWVESQPCKSTM